MVNFSFLLYRNDGACCQVLMIQKSEKPAQGQTNLNILTTCSCEFQASEHLVWCTDVFQRSVTVRQLSHFFIDIFLQSLMLFFISPCMKYLVVLDFDVSVQYMLTIVFFAEVIHKWEWSSGGTMFLSIALIHTRLWSYDPQMSAK